ncbi:MAG: hypothetical protein ABIW82_07185 [Dokdonella sp.]
MEIFTARPQRIVGNIAVASLIAGVPMGVALAILGIVSEPAGHSLIETLKGICSGALLCPAVLFVVGMIVVAPIVAGLRHVGYAGPFSIYSISLVFGLIAIADDVRFGTIALVVSLVASHVFCRYAYRDAAVFPGID